MTPAQRKALAAGKLLGKTGKQIAAETGLSHSTITKHSCDPRTQTLIGELKAQHDKQLRRTYAKALNRTEKLVDDTDPIVGLRAAKLAVDMVTAGDPPLGRLELDVASGERDCTLEELLSTFRRATMVVIER